MYSVSKSSKVMPCSPAGHRHFFAASIPSSNSCIHFSYSLVALQQEIEKRTFYLGKYRKTEEAQHLLDLIGMSRDEGDLLYPFVQAAMADVYDNLNLNTIHVLKEYEWKEPQEAITIPKKKNLYQQIQHNVAATISDNKHYVIISGTIDNYSSDDIDVSKYRITADFSIDVTTKYNIIGTNVIISPVKYITFNIPAEHLRSIGNNAWQIVPLQVEVPLDPQSTMTSAETIDKVSSPTFVVDSLKLEEINPTELPVGTIIEVEGQTYEITQDTNSNTLDLSKQAKNVDPNETLVEGVHYYLYVPNFINLSSVAPLDNAIMEALVNRIIWKWLVLSYPNEAATYDTLYQDSLKSIALRCNIFNKHWQQVPRIL